MPVPCSRNANLERLPRRRRLSRARYCHGEQIIGHVSQGVHKTSNNSDLARREGLPADESRPERTGRPLERYTEAERGTRQVERCVANIVKDVIMVTLC